MDALGRPFFIGAIMKSQKKGRLSFSHENKGVVNGHVTIEDKGPVNRHVAIEAKGAVNRHATIEEESSVRISVSIANEAIKQLGLKEGGKSGACSASSCPARWNGEDQAALSAGKIFAPCMIPGTSTRKGRLPGKIHTLCIRNRPIAPRNECIGRTFCHLQREKHAFRANVARKTAFFAQSARRGYMWRDSCHIGQNNLKDGHSEVMCRRSIGPKEDPRAAAKSPSAKATPTRPSSLTARSNTQISLRPRQPRESVGSRG